MNFPDLPHLKQLQKDLWRWPKSRAALMVGAGFSLNSVPLPGVTSRFPTWRQLVRAMFDELRPLSSSATSDELQKRHESFLAANTLRLASEYEAAFGKTKLEDLIRHQNPDPDHEPGPLHTLLLQLPWADVFTTNYDTLLERTAIVGRTYQPVTKTQELTSSFCPRIIKLHGSFPSQTPFIISEEDYRRYPSEFAPFVNSVRQSLLENSVVLVGFSGDDPNFLAWTGWIRDELGGRHAPIYLVGPLGLSPAERTLLDRRGVTPIDLAPLFVDVPCPTGIHAAALEWFLRSLAAARSTRPEKWPDSDRRFEAAPIFSPPLALSGTPSPVPVEFAPMPPGPLSMEVAVKVIARWRYERTSYPGWLIAAEAMRTSIWNRTKGWVDPLFDLAKNWEAPDQLLLFREINWRLELAMVPLFTNWVTAFNTTLDRLYSDAAQGRSPLPDIKAFSDCGNQEVLTAWLEVAFALLRDARESYDGTAWDGLNDRIDKVIAHRPQLNDRHFYERALWAMWNIDRAEAKAVLSCWQPSVRSPLAAMWKASLLAELDQLGEAKTILRAALSEIRRGLSRGGRNIELLSLEGWCTYLLFSVETALDFSRYDMLLEEFWERWEELKAWDCNPWSLKEYFQNALSAPPPKPTKAELEVRGFDPGEGLVTYNLGGDTIDPYLPGFACIRFYEQVGIPMHLPRVRLMGNALLNACRWIAPFTTFWSPALLIRAANADGLKNSHFLSRAKVAAMQPSLAKRLYDWCITILSTELDNCRGTLIDGSLQESLFEVLPEVLSRLAFKADVDQLTKAFKLALRLHGLLGVRSHIRLHESSEPWFRRLFEAAETILLVEWLPDLIKAPLFAEDIHPFARAGRGWPDPMKHFPVKRVAGIKDLPRSLLTAVVKATDWLIRRAGTEEGESRRRAIDRLTDLYHATLMSPEQQQLLGELLWSRMAATGLPDRPNLAAFGLLHLPAPESVNVTERIKAYILALPAQTHATRDNVGKISGMQADHRHKLIYEVSLCSRPLIQLRGKPNGTIDWTVEESKQLYTKVRAWWANDKEAILLPRLGINPVLDTLHYVPEVLARAVIPKLEEDDPVWKELFDWLKEMRGSGAYPTTAFPYVLGKQPAQAPELVRLIADDLEGDTPEAVAAAAEALRHWAALAAINRAPNLSPDLLQALLGRVIFRRKAAIEPCLWHLTFLMLERPETFTASQMSLVASSLISWHATTILPPPTDADGEFSEEERPSIRLLLARLAGATAFCLKRSSPHEPDPAGVKLWRNACASDPLPEVRRAFADFAEHEATAITFRCNLAKREEQRLTSPTQ